MQSIPADSHLAGHFGSEVGVVVGMVTHRRTIGRYREIGRVLMAHGFGGLLAPYGPLRRWTLTERDMRAMAPDTSTVRAQHLRLALEELGPAFIKLGQILATRVDLLPPAYIAELERLQDRVAPDDFANVRACIEEGLGRPLEELFLRVDAQPIAAASLGQVHAATLRDGREVVVKVQRAGVAATVDLDVQILNELAAAGERRSSFLRGMNVAPLVEEFGWTIRSELDYLQEARHADRMRDASAKDATVRIPEIIWTHTSTTVLTMERLRGIRIDDVEQLREAGHDPARIAHDVVGIIARQVLDIGLFHADPHPGNMIVCEDGVIGMFDFGMVGSLDDRLRERLLFLALAVSERDPVRVVDEIVAVGAVPRESDRQRLEREVGHLMTQYVGVTLREIPMTVIVDDAMRMIRRYHLRLPAELAMLVKTATMIEALARRLDPDFNLMDVAEPIIRHAVRQFASPTFWRNRLRGRPLEVALLTAALPGNIQRFISRLDRNDFTVHMQVDELPATVREINSMVNRLVLAVLASAAAIGTAMLVLALRPAWGSAESYLFIGIFVLIGALMLNVLLRVWRSGRR